MNRVQWAMNSGAAGGAGAPGGGRGGGGGQVAAGTYVVRLTVGDKVYTTSVVVLEDIWMMAEK